MIRVLALALATVATASAQLVPRLVEQPLFVSGTGGYHTYRIPAIVRANDGTLLAFCEGRKNSSSDRGDIDIVLRRSQDGGKTWSAMQVVQNEGTQTIGNPAPVVDRATGVVWLLFCRNNDRVFVTSSADHGRTWQARREITAFVKRTSWGWYATGPCHGIQLERGKHRGRLVIPCDHRDGRGVHGSHVVHSDDGGKNWQLSGVLPGDSRVAPNECVAAELSDGRIYLNLRNQHGGSTTRRRAIAYSADGGATFGPVRFDPTLIDPRVQGSALRLRSGRVLFSNPASTSSRTRLTVRSSFDETAT